MKNIIEEVQLKNWLLFENMFFIIYDQILIIILVTMNYICKQYISSITHINY